MFKVQAFRLESQHLASIVSYAQKNTLTMPPRRISQRLSWPGEETEPLPSTQTLPNIDEGHEIEAFAKIKEVEL
jgi:hypothetical protein